MYELHPYSKEQKGSIMLCVHEKIFMRIIKEKKTKIPLQIGNKPQGWIVKQYYRDVCPYHHVYRIHKQHARKCVMFLELIS